MPTVIRVGGFRVVILLPPREHEPPHVHVRTAAGEVVIGLATMDRPQLILRVARISSADVTRAYRIVEDNTKSLLASWRRYHGAIANDKD